MWLGQYLRKAPSLVRDPTGSATNMPRSLSWPGGNCHGKAEVCAAALEEASLPCSTGSTGSSANRHFPTVAGWQARLRGFKELVEQPDAFSHQDSSPLFVRAAQPMGSNAEMAALELKSSTLTRSLCEIVMAILRGVGIRAVCVSFAKAATAFYGWLVAAALALYATRCRCLLPSCCPCSSGIVKSATATKAAKKKQAMAVKAAAFFNQPVATRQPSTTATDTTQPASHGGMLYDIPDGYELLGAGAGGLRRSPTGPSAEGYALLGLVGQFKAKASEKQQATTGPTASRPTPKQYAFVTSPPKTSESLCNAGIEVVHASSVSVPPPAAAPPVPVATPPPLRPVGVQSPTLKMPHQSASPRPPESRRQRRGLLDKLRRSRSSQGSKVMSHGEGTRMEREGASGEDAAEGPADGAEADDRLVALAAKAAASWTTYSYRRASEPLVASIRPDALPREPTPCRPPSPPLV